MSEYKNFNVIRIGCSSPWLLLVLLSDATCARASSVSSVDAPFFYFFSRMRARIFCFRRLAETPDGKSEAVCAQISIHAALLFVKLFCHLYLSGFRIHDSWQRSTWRVFSSRISRGDRCFQISISLFKLTGLNTKDFATFSLRYIHYR